MQGVRPGAGARFRVFVSSTFEDLTAERDVLQRGLDVDGRHVEGAFPRLRQLCADRGARFQAIDLRWGVSEEAGLDQRTIPLCLAEVERCRRQSPRPSFVALLGDRYGWRPLPYQIPLGDWATVDAAVDADQRSLLERWYRRDDNAVPAARVLQPRTGEARDPETWRGIEERLRAALDRGLGPARSATEQEIESGVLAESGDGNAFAFLRTVEGLPGDAAPYVDLTGQQRDASAARAVADLRERLRARLGPRAHEYVAAWRDGSPSHDHLVSLNEDVYAALAGVIEAELDRLAAQDPLEVERQAHLAFGRERVQDLVGRTELLSRLRTLLREDPRDALLIHGAAGCGKSAVMAALADRARERDASVVTRFVGATPASSLGSELLRSIWREVARGYGSDLQPPGDTTALMDGFAGVLGLATAERPLTVLIDALDQLQERDPVRQLSWLPRFLPDHVHVVLSTRPGAVVDRFRGRVGEDRVVEVPGLSVGEGTTLLGRWLGASRRTLTEDQRQRVLRAFHRSGGMPLHLRLATEEARRWPSWHDAGALPGDVSGLVQRLFDRLSDEAEHGSLLVARTLGLLAASRHGLTEDEILDLLSSDPEVMADFVRRSPRSPKVDRLPVVVWARLAADLEPYLVSRIADSTVTLGFFHRELADAARRTYLSGEDERRRHAQLADHFVGWAGPAAGVAGREVAALPDRVLGELAYQLARGGRGDEAVELVLRTDLVVPRIRTAGPAVFLDDLDEVASAAPEAPAVPLLREAVLLSVDALTRDPAQVAGQLLGRLRRVADVGIMGLVLGLDRWRGTAFLRPLTASLTPPGEPVRARLRGRNDPVTALATSDDGLLVAAGSCDREIRVWDLRDGTEVVRFVGSRPGASYAEGQGGDRIAALRFEGGTLLAASVDRCVYRIDLRAGSGEMVVQGETDNLYAVALHPDGTRAVAVPYSIWGWGQKTLEQWDLGSGQSRGPAAGYEGLASVVAVAGDGATAVSAGANGPLVGWDLRTNRSTWASAVSACSVAVSADGTWIAAGGENGLVQVVRVTDGRATVTGDLRGHRDEVLAVAFTDTGGVVSGGNDGTVRVWEPRSGREVRRLGGGGSAVTAVAVVQDRVVSGSVDGLVTVWDLARARPRMVGPEPFRHDGPVLEAAVGDVPATAATRGADDRVVRWDLTSARGEEVDLAVGAAAECAPVDQALLERARRLDEEAPRAYDQAQHEVTAAAVSRDGRWAITACTDHVMIYYRLNVTRDESRVRWWDLASGERRRVLDFHEVSGTSYSRAETARAVALDGDGRVGASGGDDHRVRVWDLGSGEVVASFDVESTVTALAMAADGSVVVAGDAGGRVHLLRLEVGDWQPPPSRQRPDADVDHVPDSPVAAFTAASTRAARRLDTDHAWVESVALSADGERALTGGDDGAVVRWNVVDGRHETLEVLPCSPWATAVAWAPDGTCAAAWADGTVVAWDNAGDEVARLSGLPDGAWSLVADHDGRWLVGDGRGGVSRWDPRSSFEPARATEGQGAVTGLVLLADGGVGRSSVDGSLAVVDPGGEPPTRWRSTRGLPRWCLAGDGESLLAGCGARVEVWDAGTGSLCRSLDTGHRATVSALLPLPGGDRVLTGATDGEVRVVDRIYGGGRLVARAGGAVTAFALADDARHVLVAAHDAVVALVDTDPGVEALPDDLRHRFSDEEWGLLRLLPGSLWSYVAHADGKVQGPETVPPTVPGTLGTPAARLALDLVAQHDPSTAPDPARPFAAGADGDLGLARGLLRRRLTAEEYADVVTTLLASAREVARSAGRLLRPRIGPEEEEALAELERRLR